MAEAKEALTVEEFRHWCEYRNKYGAISLQTLLRQSLATTNNLIASAGKITKKDGTKFKREDFMLGTQSIPKDLADIDSFDEFVNFIQ